MKSRIHFKTGGLISHSTPDGKSILGKYFILRKKFLNGDITSEELMELADLNCKFRKASNKNKRTQKILVKVFGTSIEISENDCRNHNTLEISIL